MTMHRRIFECPTLAVFTDSTTFARSDDEELLFDILDGTQRAAAITRVEALTLHGALSEWLGVAPFRTALTGPPRTRSAAELVARLRAWLAAADTGYGAPLFERDQDGDELRAILDEFS